MIKNELFRQCLAAVPAEQKAQFELSLGLQNVSMKCYLRKD